MGNGNLKHWRRHWRTSECETSGLWQAVQVGGHPRHRRARHWRICEHSRHFRGEEGQVISTLIVTLPVLMLIFLVFFTLTVTQASSIAQTAADAAVLRIQEHDALRSLPPDDPATSADERKLAFIELVRSDRLIQEGRSEVYRRLCPSNRWIVGDSCSDWGYNWPLYDEYDESEQRIDCLGTPPDRQDPNATARVPPPRGDNADGYLYNWPDVKVWIAFPNFPLPGRNDANNDGHPELICRFNPLSDIEPGDERWQQMMSYPLETWRVVVLVEVRPVIPGLMNFFVGDTDQGPLQSVQTDALQRQAISCGPLFLSGSPDLWKC